jgi:hypothetical protein
MIFIRIGMGRGRRRGLPRGLVLLVVVAVLLVRFVGQHEVEAPGAGAAAIVEAFENERSGVWVEAGGEVVHILPNDDKPPRHQNFLVEVAPHHTVKISHNVDIAPRAPVTKGSRIGFRGRYEYNEKGGVVHWTHRDPSGAKTGGHLEIEGRLYR